MVTYTKSACKIMLFLMLLVSGYIQYFFSFLTPFTFTSVRIAGIGLFLLALFLLLKGLNDEEKEEEIQRYTSKIDLWQKGLDKAKKELDKRQGSAPIRKAKQLYEDMQVIESIFYKTKERIFEEIVSKLQVSANEMYGALTKGNQTFGGTLNFTTSPSTIL